MTVEKIADLFSSEDDPLFQPKLPNTSTTLNATVPAMTKARFEFVC